MAKQELANSLDHKYKEEQTSTTALPLLPRAFLQSYNELII